MKKSMIFFVAIALVCFTVPAMAVDWNFYGSARMRTFYVSQDFQDDASLYPTPDTDSDADTQWDLQGNSRFGADVKADHIRGRIEMGITETNVSARRVYGIWNFGAASLKVGKDYTPVSQFISAQAFDSDLGLLGVGTMYGSRVGQLAVTFGGFEIALIDTATRGVAGEFIVGGLTFDFANGDVDTFFPKIEAKWGMSFDAFNFNIAGGYNYFSVSDVVSSVDGSKNDIDVSSYTIGADGGFNFGPAFVKGAVSFGQNWGNANWAIPGNFNQGADAQWDGDDSTDDVKSYQVALVGGMKLSDMLSFEVGGGYRVDDPDEGDKSKPWAAYANSTIALAPGVFVVPEIGYFQGDQTYAGDDTLKQWYAGAKWQINF